jgi:hypothetical protein
VLRDQFNHHLLAYAFPKRSDTASKALSAEVRGRSAPSNDAKPNAKPADTQQLATLLGQCSNDTKGLWLDLAIALHNGQELWLDHGNTYMHALHTSQHAHAPQDLQLHARTLRGGK